MRFLMNNTHKCRSSRIIVALAIPFALLGLMSCSGESQIEQPEPVFIEGALPGGEVEPNQATTPEKGSSEIIYVNEGFDEQQLDSDKDGLLDAIDAYPDTPLIAASGDQALSIETLATFDEASNTDGNIVMGAVVKGRLLHSEAFTPPFYLIWHGQKGSVSTPITPDESGDFEAEAPEIFANSVTVSAQGLESTPLLINTVAALAPRIFHNGREVYTGDYVDLEGKNLQDITNISLGDESLDFTIVNDTLTIKIPDQITSNRLIWQDEKRTYTSQLNLMRTITVKADLTVPDVSRWFAMGSRKQYLTPIGNHVYAPVQITLPVSSNVQTLRFYHPEYRDLQGLVWPHTREVHLGLKSTIKTALHQKLSPHFAAQDSLSIEAALSQLLDSPAGKASTSALSELHSAPTKFENERLLNQQIELLVHALSEQTNRIFSSERFLNNITQSIGGSSVFDYLDDTFTAIFATNVMYEPISSIVGLRAKPGSNTYADLSIGMYRDASTCVGLTPTLPRGIWPSDLCVSNSAVYFASVKVTRRVDGKVLKNHVKDMIDPNTIGASGWGITALDEIGYLTSDKGDPLCHMQSCSLEFITGGLGIGTNVSLNKQQQRVYSKVLGRTMLERVVIPSIAWSLSIANVDAATGKCLADFVIKNGASSVKDYGVMIVDFKKKIDAANTQEDVLVIMKDTLFKYAYDVAASMLASEKPPKCLPGPKSQYLDSLKDKAGKFAKKLAVPFEIANVATQAFQGFNAATAPEMFTFAVAPRAAITRMTSSTSTDNIPDLLSTNDDDRLFIRGTKFVYLKQDNKNYWPKLRLRDKYGNKQTLQLNESHKVDISDLSWVDIAIPVSDLRPLMKKLRGDIINVSIIMDDQAYPEFSSEGLPLPGRDIRWVGQPKLFKATPQNIRRGRLLTLLGENLQSFSNRSDLKLKYIQSDGNRQKNQI